MKIAIFGQSSNQQTNEAIRELILHSETFGLILHFEEDFHASLSEQNVIDTTRYASFDSLDKSYECLISVGGDGTMLRSVTYVGALNIPIIGINTGRLGFLATIQKSQIEQALKAITRKDYEISERSLLQIATNPQNDELLTLDFALNEIAVSRKNTTSMITVATYLNDEYLTSYWADGLIISTPTGSTGYSLSCGGPVIMPEAANLALTPIAPHNLSARPLVISDETTIKLKVSGREDNFLVSLDSRIATLSNETEVQIKKAPFSIKMLELKDESFLDTLRKKLLWGEDKRN